MAQNWTNSDGLFLQFGTDKAIAETAGEFLSYGDNRIVEVFIDLTKLTTTAAIQSNTEIFPAGLSNQMFIEQVQVVVETGATTSSSATLDVGLIQMDRATIPSNYTTAFINAETQSNLSTAGKKITYVQNTTNAGGLIGSSPSSTTGPYYITATTGTGTFTAGKVRVRIFYHGLPPITQ